MTVARDESLDLGVAWERFEEATDFTMAVEEEFAILDPVTLELSHGFERMFEEAQEDPLLAESVRGELIDTEIEIRSGRSEDFAEMKRRQREHRRLLFDLAGREGRALAACGTHPWADYLDQAIIDTPHYRRLSAELGWVAQRNNTWSLHVHVGVRGADRAVAVCDSLRNVLPLMLAISANSPFLDNRDTGLASVRSEIFTRTFPRCGIHDPFGDWRTYAEFVDLLERTNSIVESTQLWWSIRPHHSFGTVEVRICDAQTDGEESFALAGLMVAAVAQACADHDDGVLAAPRSRARGEPLAGDPPRPRRADDRLRRGGGGPDRGRGRAARRVDRARPPGARDRPRRLRPDRPERRPADALGGRFRGDDR